ncbi:MAG TPA: hemerythrin domain-containing protein [Jatrophihabitans sp.]|jgi:hypothetical protein|nr:hemerythrin domain-containing protein [Jatrophihabitans sp.]
MHTCQDVETGSVEGRYHPVRTGCPVDQVGEIRSLLDEVIASTGETRSAAFFRLRRLLAVHETAEEQFVHSQLRLGAHADPVANARLAEETAAQKVLVELELLRADADKFTTGMIRLRYALIAHVEAEEREEFPRLHDPIDDHGLLSESLAWTDQIAENADAGGFSQ